ncbi:MAG: undecaprenyldiphospho-muramoylpentapeptide beta-N-acetylglucosaminyltransferase [Candidatus Puniceispirillum sp.]|nr:undecaprenyldiphospho-muramoylpentapeptide beta-N-acetylglucosaminyltransferase [Candidatus Puniceispirillum sp.]
MTPNTLFIVAGGTGGHVMPALALRHALTDSGLEAHFICDMRGQKYVPHDMPHTHTMPLASKSPLGIARAVLWSMKQLRAYKPSCVVSFGGYPAFPMNIAALLLRVPLMLHEQNALMGRVNRLFAPFASKVALSWEKTQGLPTRWMNETNIHVTGLPVRQDFETLRNQSYTPCPPQEPFHILVLGGSQGATIFSKIVPKTLASLSEKLHKRIRLTMQCPASSLKEAKDICQKGNIEAHVDVFFQNVSALLKEAHLVICRSGASSVAEIAYCGRPALFVPYPLAKDDHQRWNAQSLVDEGGAWMLDQEHFTQDRLTCHIERLAQNPHLLLFAAERARALAHPRALQALVGLVREVMPYEQRQAVKKEILGA